MNLRAHEANLLFQYQALSELPTVPCWTENLRQWDVKEFADYIASHESREDWNQIDRLLTSVRVPEMAGGVNNGDQRLIFHLIRFLKLRSVLEIGTHIGASTVNIGAALKLSLGNEKQGHLTTVDIRDVNDSVNKPWLEASSPHSPIENLRKIECEELVSFVIDDSATFLANTKNTYDLIFLDGHHGADFVYREIPLALKRLSENGMILLHDFFPDLEPLWPTEACDDTMQHEAIVPGPFLAVQRLIREGANVEVTPFSTLPWKTKLGSNVTSLALLHKP